MSNMSAMCSGKVPGTPAGVSTLGFGESLKRSASWIRPFDLADAGQVFVELLLVAAPELSFQAAGVVEHEIQDRALLLAAQRAGFLALGRSTGAEEPLEDQARVRLGRDRQGGPAPGQVELVGAGIARVAITRLAHRVARQLERGKSRQMPDSLGGHLVDRDAGVDVGAGGLLDAHAGQERAAGAGMIARARPARRWR